jgi:hypothetical protein
MNSNAGPTLASIRRTVVVNNVYDVTNHYVTNPRHTFYGTTRRIVTNVNLNSFSLTSPVDGDATTRVFWPKTAQISMDEAGVISLYGGGATQAENELFMTLTPVATT